jgi:hypothetical protein
VTLHLSTARFAQQEKVLLDECKRIGPTGISPLNNGRANFATTYSTNFCEVVADLLFLYKSYSVGDPIAKLSENFRRLNIDSCRGADMTYERVKYLVEVNVAKLGETKTYRVLKRLTKSMCPVCGQWKTNLEQHVRDAHP